MSVGCTSSTGSALPRLCGASMSAVVSHCWKNSLLIIGVSTPQGCTELTRMFCGARWFAYALIRPTTPCLAAA
ncbi:Uncharacterised protein [Mycobacterium tuberculosis]|nr:Uncharacterised protein [Mycobacterium tuberculosis]